MAPQLDSNLSRRLLDRGALRVEQLEEAAQQQVIHGGALDTLLLELGQCDETTLTQALQEAWATEPVDPSRLSFPPGAASTWLPERMAVRMALCPFKEEAGALHVLCAAPIDRELLEEVGTLVGRSLVPHVVPEVRLHQTLARAYDLPIDERFAALLAHLDDGAPIDTLTTRSAEAVVERAQRSSWDLVEALANLAAQDHRSGISRVAVQYARQFLPFAAIFGVRAGSAVGWTRSGGGEGAQFAARPLPIPSPSVLQQVLDSPSPLLGKPPLGDGNATFLGWLGRRRPRTALLIPIIVARRPVAVLYGDGGVRARTYDELSDLVAFGARLGPAFEALLRARHRDHADIFRAAASAGTPAEASPPAPAPDAGPPPDGAPSPRDGTSPFARGYRKERAEPPTPRVEATLRMDGDGAWSLVLDGGAPAAPAAPATDMKAWGDAVPDTGEHDEVDEDLEVFGEPVISPVADESTQPYASSPAHGLEDDNATVSTESTEASDSLEMSAADLEAAAAELEAAAGSLALELSAGESPGDLHTGEESIVLDTDIARDSGLDLDRGARVSFRPLGANLGLERSSTALVLEGEAPPGDVPLGSFLDDEEGETGDVVDETVDEETSGMFPVGTLSDSDKVAFELAATGGDDFDHAEAQLEHVATGGFRNLLASVTDALPPDEGPVFDKGSDEHAAPAWAGALATTVSEGRQGGQTRDEPVLAGEDGWEDVVLDAAYSSALRGDSASLPPSPAPVEGAPELSVDTAPVADALDVEVALHTADLEMATIEAARQATSPPAAPPEEPEEEPLELVVRKKTQPATPDVKDLIEMLGAMDQMRVREAMWHLRAMGPDVLPELIKHFPGRLLCDPFAENVVVEAAADLGPMIELIESMGELGLNAAIPHLDSKHPAHRYCATFLFVLVPDERAMDLMRKRLHDHEPRIRMLATAALTHFIAHPKFAHVLQHLRDRLASPSAEARERAIAMLGNFRDVGAIPALIDMLEEKHAAIPLSAREALNQITFSDHGPKAKAWNKWWEKARKKTRMDWLIEGLKSKDRQTRFFASSELLALTGQDFGFNCDAGKKEREIAVRNVEHWWDDERARMTG